MKGKNKGFWLDGDPDWADIRNRLKRPDVQSLDASSRRTKKTSINETETKISGSPNKLLKKFLNNTTRFMTYSNFTHTVSLIYRNISRSKLAVAASILTIIFTVATVTGVFSNDKQFMPDVKGDNVEQDTNPQFKALFPNGSESETTDNRIAYDPEKQVVSFRDKVGNANATISQQELPEDLKTDTEAKIEQLAIGFNATEVINESNPKAYLGTSSKGPQTVIFHKNGLLVFIQSSQAVDREIWAEYITRLL